MVSWSEEVPLLTLNTRHFSRQHEGIRTFCAATPSKSERRRLLRWQVHRVGKQDGTIGLARARGTPFHTLPYQEIPERLRGLTNLSVVPDEASGTGYRVEIGPFPGWKALPEW